jgi:hypothetical protein
MSSLFEKCASCGNETPGLLFCSNTCRFAASPRSNRNAKISSEDNPAFASATRDTTKPTRTDPVVDKSEITGPFLAELDTQPPEDSRRELTEYEELFNKGR